MNIKIKSDVGRKGELDPKMVGLVALCVVVIGISFWYYVQPTPPAPMVTGLDSLVKQEGDRCTAIVTGKVFNNGDITAKDVSVRCDAGSGSKRPGFKGVGDVEGRASVNFEVRIPLKSCSESISESCEITS